MANKSIHYGLRQQIVTDLQALVTGSVLTGIPSANILNYPVPAWRAIQAGTTQPLPAIIVSPMRKYENPDEGTNEEDDIVFPVLVEFLMENGQNLSASSDEFESWSEIVSDKYRHRYLNVTDPAVQFFRVDVEYFNPFDPEAWKNPSIWAGALLIKPTIRLPRGTN